MEDSALYLIEALKLAEQRRGFCFPNPSVGAVLVQGGSILAKGLHEGAGHPHAEVMALKDTTMPLEHATLYVTLEPCCHWGRTPPCTDLLIQKGIKKVVYGYQDPNPTVAGKGAATLRQQGVDCQQIDLPEINNFYQSYTHWTLTKQPWVTCKLAISMDAKIADAAGEPIAITGKEAQNLTHTCRLKADAILTSVRTIIQDDPALNVRLEDKVYSKPVYVLDSQLSLPLTAHLFNTAANITVFHSQSDKNKINQLKNKGVECRFIVRDRLGLSLVEVLKSIGSDGIHDLWVEAGGATFSSFIREGLTQKGLLYIAPKLLGASAQPAFAEETNLFSKAKKINWDVRGQDGICEIFFT